MQLSRKIVWLFVMMTSLFGCIGIEPDRPPTVLPISTADLVSATDSILEENDIDPQSTRETCQPTYQNMGSAKPAYRLEAVLDLDSKKLIVLQSISYPNVTGQSLDEIRLVIDPNWRKGTFKLNRISLMGVQNSRFLLSGGTLDLPLDPPLPTGCTVELDLEFSLQVPNQIGILGYTDHQVILTNWFPFIPPYKIDHGWVSHKLGKYGEHLVYPAADFEVLLEYTPNSADVQVAAPVHPVVDGKSYSFHLDDARTFSIAILTGYQSLEQQINGVTTRVYYRTANPKAAQSALQTMEKAITTYSDLFGPYPFDQLTLAEIEMFDGMEYDGIFFLGQDVFSSYNGTPQHLLTLLAAHETSHNWWFSQVGNDQALDPWLDEALATYCELLFLESNYPELVGWWWDFRINSVRPTGRVNATIFTYSNYEQYRQAVYLRGVQFLHALRNEMGDDRFFDFLQQYYGLGKGNIMTDHDFFEILEKVFSPGVDSLRQEFFSLQ